MPTVEKLAQEYEGRIEIQKVNVDNNRELAAHFEVKSIPALIFMKQSKITERITGLVPDGNHISVIGNDRPAKYVVTSYPPQK